MLPVELKRIPAQAPQGVLQLGARHRRSPRGHVHRGHLGVHVRELREAPAVLDDGDGQAAGLLPGIPIVLQPTGDVLLVGRVVGDAGHQELLHEAPLSVQHPGRLAVRALGAPVRKLVLVGGDDLVLVEGYLQ